MKPMITAHSGAENTPDNSWEYVQKAFEIGAEALEVDVRETEGSLAIGHDNAGETKLQDVFELLVQHKNVLINCDLKESGLEMKVFALAEKCGCTAQLVYSGEVNPENMSPEARETVDVYLNVENIETDIYRIAKEDGEEELLASVKRAAEVLKTQGVKVMNMPWQLATDSAVRMLRDMGIGVSAWTVNDDSQIRRLSKVGCKNITSRTPVKAMRLRDKFALKSIYKVEGTLQEGFVGHVCYTVDLGCMYDHVRIHFAFDKQRLTRPFDKRRAEEARTALKSIGQKHDDEAVEHLLGEFKTEIQMVAMLGGQFLGGIHRQMSDRTMEICPEYATEGAAPRGGMEGALEVKLIAFNVLYDDTRYVLEVEAGDKREETENK